MAIFYQFSHIIEGKIDFDQQRTLEQVKLNVEDLENSLNQSVVYLFSDKKVGDMLSNEIPYGLELINNITLMNELFRDYVNVPISPKTQTYFAVLYVYDDFQISNFLDSVPMDSVQHYMNAVYSAKSVKNESWFRETEKKNGQIHTFIIDNHRNNIYISRIIRNKYTKSRHSVDAVGVSVIGLGTAELGRIFKSAMLTRSTRIFLLNGENRIIYSSEKGYFGRIASETGFMDDDRIGGNQRRFDIQLDNGKYLVNNNQLQWNWRLVTVTPYSEIYEGIDPVRRIVLFTIVLTVMLAVFITILLSLKITRPVVRLAKTMNRFVREGDTGIRISNKYSDEVGMLYDNFNKMMNRIKELLDEVYESTLKQKNSELKALQAQINPHFIYNTLDTISCIAMTKDEDDIVMMVSSLAYIMRYSIREPENKVLLSEELFHVEKYANIQRFRYGDSFSMEACIDEGALKCMIPKFIIQPLVENAILHGTGKLDGGGRIVISVKVREDVIDISVADNGPGGDVDALNLYLEGKLTHIRDSDGFGIKNVNERIKLNYGDAYGLKYEIDEKGNFEARITIPKNYP